jgi:hypothetical protein
MRWALKLQKASKTPDFAGIAEKPWEKSYARLMSRALCPEAFSGYVPLIEFRPTTWPRQPRTLTTSPYT